MYKVSHPFALKGPALATTATVDAAIVEAKRIAAEERRTVVVYGDERIRVIVLWTGKRAEAQWAIACPPCKGTGTSGASMYGSVGSCDRCNGLGALGDIPCQ